MHVQYSQKVFKTAVEHFLQNYDVSQLQHMSCIFMESWKWQYHASSILNECCVCPVDGTNFASQWYDQNVQLYEAAKSYVYPKDALKLYA